MKLIETWSYFNKYEEFKKNHGRQRKMKFIGKSFNTQGGAFSVDSSYIRNWSYLKLICSCMCL